MGNGLVEALLGLPGFRVLTVVEGPSELVVTVETVVAFVRQLDAIEPQDVEQDGALVLSARPDSQGVVIDLSPTMLAATRDRFGSSGRVEVIDYDIAQPLPAVHTSMRSTPERRRTGRTSCSTSRRSFDGCARSASTTSTATGSGASSPSSEGYRRRSRSHCLGVVPEEAWSPKDVLVRQSL